MSLMLTTVQTNIMMKKFLLAIPCGILSLIAIGIIAYLSLSPDPLGTSHISLFPESDKVVHFLMYFVCTSVFFFDYAKYRLPHHTKLNVQLALTASAITLGLLMEVGQLVMQMGRAYDFLDILANSLGAIAALAAFRVIGERYFRDHFFHGMRHHRRHH